MLFKGITFISGKRKALVKSTLGKEKALLLRK